MPKLSLVIPAYNNADFLGDTIESILDQDFTDWELLIADHSSSDGTWEVMNRYASDPRIRLMTTEKGGGAPRNWNRVTDEATGEYLKLVCGDDLLRAGTLSAQVRALDEHPAATLVASPRDIVDARGDVLIPSRGLSGLHGEHPGGTAIRATVKAGSNILGEPACVTMRRTALVEAGGWDGRFPYLIDEATYARVLLQGRFVGVPQTGAAFRLNGGQWSVALASSQSDQAIAFHRWMHELRPDIVSKTVLRIGNARARVMAYARRAVYVVYARRMKAERGA